MSKIQIGEIQRLKRKAIKEAQRATDKIFKKYSKEINKAIAEQIPKGMKLISGNGMCMVLAQDGTEIDYGNAWSITADYNPKMEAIAELQYGTDAGDLQGNFWIDSEIIGTKKLLEKIKAE